MPAERRCPPASSVERVTQSGRTRRFPGRQDFVDALVQCGQVAEADELFGARRDLLPDVFHVWVQRGQVACQFAMNLAKHRQQAGWVEIVQTVDEHPSLWLEPLLEAAADHAQAVLVVLPDVESLDDLARFFAQLCELPRWSWEVVPAGDANDDDHVCVGVRWQSPEGPKSWVLAFGDLPGMPFTRRSPVPALALRTRGPANDHGTLDLARMDHVRQGDAFERDGELTRRNKGDLLNGELEHVARARVTLRLPHHLVELLPHPSP